MGSAVARIRIGRPLLGDVVESALSKFGITAERVSGWFGGRNCGCKERKELLNRLDRWARNVIGLGTSDTGVVDEQLREATGESGSTKDNP